MSYEVWELQRRIAVRTGRVPRTAAPRHLYKHSIHDARVHTHSYAHTVVTITSGSFSPSQNHCWRKTFFSHTLHKFYPLSSAFSSSRVSLLFLSSLLLPSPVPHFPLPFHSLLPFVFTARCYVSVCPSVRHKSEFY